MKSFAKLTRVVTLKITFSTILSIVLLNFLWTFPFGLWQWAFGLALFLFFSLFVFSVVGVCKFFHDKKQKEWAERACEQFTRQIDRFKLFLRILFLNPEKYKYEEDYEHKNLRFIFTEYGKISTLGGENALAYMIAALNTKIESELGTFITRLCRVFYHKNHSHSKFRRVCCIPSFVMVILVALLLIGLAVFFRVKGLDFKSFKTQELTFIISIFFIVIASIFGSVLTWSKMILSFISSPSSHILNVVHSKDRNQPYHESKVENIIFKLKKEVDYISHTVKTIDSFTHGRTRLVIVIGK
jgi:ankyrin repeat-rich membrane spanning protein